MSEQPQLPKELEHSDVEDLMAMIRMWRSIQGWCRVTRWIMIGIIGVVVAFAQFGDAVKHIIGWKVR